MFLIKSAIGYAKDPAIPTKSALITLLFF